MTGHRGIPGDVDWGAPGADLLREELNDERGAGGTGGVMAIVVQTVTTCELCGAVDVRQGAEGHTPPVGWSEMVIRTRGVGAGWSNTGRPFDGVICPVCTERMAQCIAAWAAGWKLVRWKTSSAAEAGDA